MLKEFKAFIMKGNVLDLAVAVIIATAFGAIVSSFTNDVLMPPIGEMIGGVDFEDLKYVIKEPVLGEDGSVITEEVAIKYGAFINTIIDFLIIAFVIFLIVRSYNRYMRKPEEPAAPSGPTTEELLADIRDILKKG
ncbi:MAG: large-conductance mechanosensitive channel protein MscL [Saprospiraceae bacterium]|nr:large-conductance mechanosensitive channel protein MscL [Saprospiraceae bacterium]